MSGALIESGLCLVLALAPYVEREIGRLLHGVDKIKRIYSKKTLSRPLIY